MSALCRCLQADELSDTNVIATWVQSNVREQESLRYEQMIRPGCEDLVVIDLGQQKRRGVRDEMPCRGCATGAQTRSSDSLADRLIGPLKRKMELLNGDFVGADIS
jgi:hypothetical protein